jgi:FkbM family methyltransferase
MRLTRYDLKRLVLRPHTAYMRRRTRDLDHVSRSILEAQYYRPTMYRFLAASAEEPDILVDFDLDERSIVLDVGAYVGDWSAAVASRYGARVYAFEPVPHAAATMRDRFAGDPHVTCFELGLGAVDERVDLALDGPGSSRYSASGLFGTATVEIRDVVAVLDELGLDRVDLLKCNIEGAEYDLFDRLIEAGWLPRIGIVAVQFHEWHPRAYTRRRAIRRALARTHDEVWDYPFVWERWRRRG